MAKCIIVGAGDFSEKKLSISEGDLVIAVDGGYNHLTSIGIEPTIIIGDFDSLDTLPQHIPALVFPKEKDETDLALAIEYGVAKKYTEFYIYGAIGGRIEHTIANIQLLHALSNRVKKAHLINGDLHMVVLHNKCYHLSKEHKGYLSVFALSETAIVTLKGLKYELHEHRLSCLTPLGIDNEFIDQDAVVDVTSGAVLLVYYHQKT